MQIVSVDIGGTHARFALAEVADGKVVSIGEALTLKTAEYASFQSAWVAFGVAIGAPLPRATGIAFAGPVSGEVLQLTNSHWTVRPGLIPSRLNVDQFTLVNDFGAVGHAVAQANDQYFSHLCGPDVALPHKGVITVVGPGTGLGVSYVFRADERYHVNATEGGHVDYAPMDRFEDALLGDLRAKYRRVSAERIVSGPGLQHIYEALAKIEKKIVIVRDDKELWTAALDGTDTLAVAALDRFCMALGSVAGDLALAQGGNAVVIAGGLGARIAGHLPRSGFAQRFVAKGRFEPMMAAMPVKLITLDQPGLFGAAAAFAMEHTR
ncbi:glucokinase [Sphingomonas paeninsulae]|jgi:glucokinase|uniref:Glucokinase n=1 Tax=Sphingomonas paeninsulae TaxID=2319844 RepID=A0A494TN38_SPHPE|nr:glucokinase [Sphingomonas paeninsulae]AYJ87271.1 glucokinase [Sphingomonas paeninsulae]